MRAIYRGTYGSPAVPRAYPGPQKDTEVLDVQAGFYGGTKVDKDSLKCKGHMRGGQACSYEAIIATGYCQWHSDKTEAMIRYEKQPIRQCKGIKQDGKRCSIKHRDDYCKLHRPR